MHAIPVPILNLQGPAVSPRPVAQGGARPSGPLDKDWDALCAEMGAFQKPVEKGVLRTQIILLTS